MTVFQCLKGDIKTIAAVNVQGAAAQRLKSMGFVAGKRVTVLGFSFFKSSVLVSCGAVRVGIRRQLAQQIEVTE